MGTAVAVRGVDGVAIAADRRVVDDGRVRSDDVEHLYRTGELAVAAVGPPSAVQAFQRELDAALRQYQLDQDGEIHAAPARRIVSDLASDAGTPALVGVRDRDGQAQLVHVDATGGTTDDDRAAIGDGEATAVGLLETVDRDERIDDLVDDLEALLRTAAEREASIGETIDTASVSDRPQ